MGFIRLISGLGVTFFFLSQLAQVLKLIFLLLGQSPSPSQEEHSQGLPALSGAKLGHPFPNGGICCISINAANSSSKPWQVPGQCVACFQPDRTPIGFNWVLHRTPCERDTSQRKATWQPVATPYRYQEWA